MRPNHVLPPTVHPRPGHRRPTWSATRRPSRSPSSTRRATWRSTSEIAKEEGLHITHILETHVHADFVSGSAELKARLGGEPKIVVSGMGGKEWTPPYADQ